MWTSPRTLLKTLLVMTIAGTLTAWGTPASPYVAQILTSIPVVAGEGDQFENAVKAAVTDVLEHAIAFVPTPCRGVARTGGSFCNALPLAVVKMTGSSIRFHAGVHHQPAHA